MDSENAHFGKTCECADYKINCLTAKEWLKSQLGVWQFFYEKRDIRDKTKHPATFPIGLAKKCIELFTHRGELVVDPFVGSGTTLVAASDLHRHCFGFDINKKYVELANLRVAQNGKNGCRQAAIVADAHRLGKWLGDETIKLVLTSPPYAQVLNRKRLNKSRRSDTRKNGQFLKVEQYSQRKNDLGTMTLENYAESLRQIFAGLKPKIVQGGHIVVNVTDFWWEGKRVPLHMDVIRVIREAGFEFRNTIIWDRTNIVNRVGIFGWPNNYITMGTTFEYLLHFQKNSCVSEGTGCQSNGLSTK